VLIDTSADIDDAARKICASKIFDNSTSCSSENSVVILDEVYDAAVAALKRAGGYLCSPAEKQAIEATLWRNGKLNRTLIAKDADVLADGFGLGEEAHGASFFMVEETGVGRDYPLSGEKLSLVLTLYRSRGFDEGKARLREILDYQGKGHSVGIHTQDLQHARALAEELDVVRVLVNFAHTFGNGGGFDSGLGFTLSMGCGSWQKNSISENLSYRHFLNITHLVTRIPEDRPTEEELFGPHWRLIGHRGEAG
jgi:sulfoacetaldehyde dehydrogenase